MPQHANKVKSVGKVFWDDFTIEEFAIIQQAVVLTPIKELVKIDLGDGNVIISGRERILGVLQKLDDIMDRALEYERTIYGEYL